MSKYVILHGFGGWTSDMTGDGTDVPTNAELNFEVVGGTTQPTNPVENTIWVNTNIEITSFVFSSTEPEIPEEGMVWIYTGIASPANFNALKQNTLNVYPLYAKQYISGAWTMKTATSYLNGEWESWSAYLFKNGNQYTDLTGGWKAASGAGLTVTIGSSAITYKVVYETARHGTAYTVNKIDVTNYSQLVCKGSISVNEAFEIGLTSQNSSNNTPAFTKYAGTSNGNANLDISSVTGEYYIGLHASKSSGSITEVYLE